MNERQYRLAEQALWQTVGLQPTEQRLRLGYTDTEVRVQEVGEGEPLLFIHGGPNAGSTWAPLVQRLPGHRCLLVDRPGTGLSEPFDVTPRNHREFASRFVSDVLDGMGVPTVDLVASSFGGMIGLYSAAATPERVGRMVQMACPAFAPGMKLPPFMRLISMGPVRRLLGALPPNPRATDMTLRQIGHGASLDAGRIPQWLGEWYEALMAHTDTMKNDGDMIGRFASVFGFDPRNDLAGEMLRSITVPTMFIWGEDDGFGGREVAEPLVASIPKATVTYLPESGHLPWFDFPEESAELIRSFLDEED